ncbi:C-GCAxxG-C-C family protein [Ihubacter sp. rT4E-8]|uniref:C-GCAxxG-C-C family protein n=1 Tax=unclassified Ihubacter TaxID=2633299 RepID=UPI003C79CBAC
MNRKELAVELHHKRYNCAQSVVCAFCDVIDDEPQTVFKSAEAFGNGMSSFSTCGAVSAMAIVIGLKNSDGNLDEPRTKSQCYKMMRRSTDMFLEKNKSTICREIKGIDTGCVLRSCDGCIEDAVAILEELLLDTE